MKSLYQQFASSLFLQLIKPYISFKKKIIKLYHKCITIPKYEKRIKNLAKTLEETNTTLDFTIKQMAKYKDKCIKLKRELDAIKSER